MSNNHSNTELFVSIIPISIIRPSYHNPFVYLIRILNSIELVTISRERNSSIRNRSIRQSNTINYRHSRGIYRIFWWVTRFNSPSDCSCRLEVHMQLIFSREIIGLFGTRGSFSFLWFFHRQPRQFSAEEPLIETSGLTLVRPSCIILYII